MGINNENLLLKSLLNKDDNSAIRFYTDFPNYKALPAFHNYFEPKVAKLQYWDPKNVPDSKLYSKLFIILVRPMVGQPFSLEI